MAFGLLLGQAAMAECFASQVSLRWDQVNHPLVAVYEVHFGNATNAYGSFRSTTETSTVVSGLEPGWQYYFAVRACTRDKTLCSGFSNEICAILPYAPQGSVADCTAHGIPPIPPEALPSRSGWRVILQ